jgi:cardiolipin synthase
VQVHVLLDWFGGQINDDVTERIRQSGADVQWYHAPSWNTLQLMNNRTHRKILVVDGPVGFTGGADIADKWQGNARNPNQWRDTHYRITGPAVSQLQAAFLDNWLQSTGRILHGPHYFPDLKNEGSISAQIFTSSRGGGSQSMQLMYLLSIASASRSVLLGSAYFVPGEAAVAQLAAAAKRGVRVQVIVPGEHIDWDLVRRASRHRWGPLLEAGVEIYEYQPTMYHLKMLVADGIWTSVGSSNFDPRSFTINDESNLNVYDEEFARMQGDMFERDLLESKRISLLEWQDRPWSDKVLDAIASLLGSQL